MKCPSFVTLAVALLTAGCAGINPSSGTAPAGAPLVELRSALEPAINKYLAGTKLRDAMGDWIGSQSNLNASKSEFTRKALLEDGVTRLDMRQVLFNIVYYRDEAPAFTVLAMYNITENEQNLVFLDGRAGAGRRPPRGMPGQIAVYDSRPRGRPVADTIEPLLSGLRSQECPTLLSSSTDAWFASVSMPGTAGSDEQALYEQARAGLPALCTEIATVGDTVVGVDVVTPVFYAYGDEPTAIVSVFADMRLLDHGNLADNPQAPLQYEITLERGTFDN